MVDENKNVGLKLFSSGEDLEERARINKERGDFGLGSMAEMGQMVVDTLLPSKPSELLGTDGALRARVAERKDPIKGKNTLAVFEANEFNSIVRDEGVSGAAKEAVKRINENYPDLASGGNPLVYEELIDGSSVWLNENKEDIKLPNSSKKIKDEEILVNYTNVTDFGGSTLDAFKAGFSESLPAMFGAGVGFRLGVKIPNPLPLNFQVFGRAATGLAGGIAGAIDAQEAAEGFYGAPPPVVPSKAAPYFAGEAMTYGLQMAPALMKAPKVGLGPVKELAGKSKDALKKATAQLFSKKPDPNALVKQRATTATQFIEDFAKASDFFRTGAYEPAVKAIIENSRYSKSVMELMARRAAKNRGVPKRYRAAGAVEKMAKEYKNLAVNNPFRFLKKELMMGAGAAAGANIAQSVSPYGTKTKLALEILGGGIGGYAEVALSKTAQLAYEGLANTKIMKGMLDDTTADDLTGGAARKLKELKASGISKMSKKGVNRYVRVLKGRPEFAPDLDENGVLIRSSEEKIGAYFDEMERKSREISGQKAEALEQEILDIENQIEQIGTSSNPEELTLKKRLQTKKLEKEDQLGRGVTTRISEIEFDNPDWTEMTRGYAATFDDFEKYLKTKTEEGRQLEASSLLEPMLRLVESGDQQSLEEAAALLTYEFRDDLEKMIAGSIEELTTAAARATGGDFASLSGGEVATKLLDRITVIMKKIDDFEEQQWRSVKNFPVYKFKIGPEGAEEVVTIPAKDRMASIMTAGNDPQDLPKTVKVFTNFDENSSNLLEGTNVSGVSKKDFRPASDVGVSDLRKAMGTSLYDEVEKIVEFFTLSPRQVNILKNQQSNYEQLAMLKAIPKKQRTNSDDLNIKRLQGTEKKEGLIDKTNRQIAKMELDLNYNNTVLKELGKDSSQGVKIKVPDYPFDSKQMIEVRSKLLKRARELRKGRLTEKDADSARRIDMLAEAIVEDLTKGSGGQNSAYDVARAFTLAKSNLLNKTFLSTVFGKNEQGAYFHSAEDVMNNLVKGNNTTVVNNMDSLKNAGRFLVKEGIIDQKDYAKIDPQDVITEVFKYTMRKFASEKNVKLRPLSRLDPVEASVMQLNENAWRQFVKNNPDLIKMFEGTNVVPDMENFASAQKLFNELNSNPRFNPVVTKDSIKKAYGDAQPEVAAYLSGRYALQNILQESPTQAIAKALDTTKPFPALKALVDKIDQPNKLKGQTFTKVKPDGSEVEVPFTSDILRKGITSAFMDYAVGEASKTGTLNVKQLIHQLNKSLPGVDSNRGGLTLLDFMENEGLITKTHRENVVEALKALNEIDTAYRTGDYTDLLFKTPNAFNVAGVKIVGATAGTYAQSMLQAMLAKLPFYTPPISGGLVAEGAGSKIATDLMVQSPITVGNRAMAQLFSDGALLADLSKPFQKNSPLKNNEKIGKIKALFIYGPVGGTLRNIPAASRVPVFEAIERDVNETNTTSSVNSPRASNIRPNPERQVATGPVTSPTTNPTAVGIQGSITPEKVGIQGSITPESAQRFAQVFPYDTVFMGIGGLVR